jgi:hypothetical protein
MKNVKNIKNVNNNLSDYSHFMLYNSLNYYPIIKYSVFEILNKFVEVIIEYMRFISEKLAKKHKRDNKFIFERGLNTLIHIFSILFYYTKNLELSFYHTQKAYYFYIEYIEQISDDNITFLQLSSRDAILFVYKKTIFELNNECKKNIKEPNIEEINILKTVNLYMNMYKNMVLYTMNYNCENKNDYINTSCNLIKNISETINKNKLNYQQIDCVYEFITFLYNIKIEVSDFFHLLDEFIKKLISKKKIDENTIKYKIDILKISNFTNNNELNMIIEHIFGN